MGLLDIFKKKENGGLFTAISRYNEYIVTFLGNQQRNNYSPIGAYETNSGEIRGMLYYTGEDDSYLISSNEVVQRTATRFEEDFEQGKIVSYVIFYHKESAIHIFYRFKDSYSGTLLLPYEMHGDKLRCYGPKEFTVEQHHIIFKTLLKGGKDYFPDMVEILPPVAQNSISLQITRSNIFSINDAWGAVVGFDPAENDTRELIMSESFRIAMAIPAQTYEAGGVKIGEMEAGDWMIRAIAVDDSAIAVVPVIKTADSMEVAHTIINEWENTSKLEAVISGRVRDTFDVTYYATDYARNRALYLGELQHNVRITGLVYELDKQYGEDEITWQANKEYAKRGCFDFIGEVAAVRETVLSTTSGNVKGYIMNVRLMPQLTIDMFVNPKNMKFERLDPGMKVKGTFVMQGEIIKGL